MRPEAFHPFARLLHWLMAVLISLHKATGLALLVLVVLRIAVRLAVPHPPLPPALPTLQRWAAGASHL